MTPKLQWLALGVRSARLSEPGMPYGGLVLACCCSSWVMLGPATCLKASGANSLLLEAKSAPMGPALGQREAAEMPGSASTPSIHQDATEKSSHQVCPVSTSGCYVV